MARFASSECWLTRWHVVFRIAVDYGTPVRDGNARDTGAARMGARNPIGTWRRVTIVRNSGELEERGRLRNKCLRVGGR